MFDFVDGTQVKAPCRIDDPRRNLYQNSWSCRDRLHWNKNKPIGGFNGTKTLRHHLRGTSDIMTNAESEIMRLYRSEETIYPSEIERQLKVSFSKRDVQNSLIGNVAGLTVSQEVVDSAKEDLKRAIDEIANAEGVQLNGDDREQLANFGILLLTKISSVV